MPNPQQTSLMSNPAKAESLVRKLEHDVQVLVRVRELLRVEPLDPRALPVPITGDGQQSDLLDTSTELSLRRIAVTWAAAVIEGLLKDELRSRPDALKATDLAVPHERETFMLQVFFCDEFEFRPANSSERAQRLEQLRNQWQRELGHRRKPRLYPEDRSTALGRFLLLRAGRHTEAATLDMTVPHGKPRSELVARAERIVHNVDVLRRARNLVLHSGQAPQPNHFARQGLTVDSFLRSPEGWTHAMATLSDLLDALAPSVGTGIWDGGRDDAHVDLMIHAGTGSSAPEPVLDGRLRLIQAAQLEKIKRFLTLQCDDAQAKRYLTPERTDEILRSGRELAGGLLNVTGQSVDELQAAVSRVVGISRRPKRWRAMWLPAMGIGKHLAVAEMLNTAAVPAHVEPYLAATRTLARARDAGVADDELPFWNGHLGEKSALALAHVSTQGCIGLDDEGLEDLRAVKVAFGAWNALSLSVGYLPAVIKLLRDVIPQYCSPEPAQTSKQLASSLDALLVARFAFYRFAEGHSEPD